MRERQFAQVTVSKQYREHAFYKSRPRQRTAVESKSISIQGRDLFSTQTQRKRGLCLQGNRISVANQLLIRCKTTEMDGELISETGNKFPILMTTLRLKFKLGLGCLTYE